MAESPTNKSSGVTLKSLLENPILLRPAVSLASNSKLKDKEKEIEEWGSDSQMAADMSAAFLGPTLWDKTLPYDGSDFKLEYMDLDEFLSENGIPTSAEEMHGAEKTSPMTPPKPTLMGQGIGVRGQLLGQNVEKIHNNLPPSPPTSPMREPSPVNVPVDFNLTPTDVALATIPGQDEFDPRCHNFSEEDLKPQPMIKKSKKNFVPIEQKDDKYWERRKKNNVAAKRSRDARRVKENQIAIKASYLSKENDALKSETVSLKKELLGLKKIIANYEKKVQMLTEKLGEESPSLSSE